MVGNGFEVAFGLVTSTKDLGAKVTTGDVLDKVASDRRVSVTSDFR